MKLKIKPWRLVWRFLIVLAILLLVIFSSTISLFYDFSLGEFRSWGSQQTIVIIVMLVVSVGSFIPSLTSTYYVCEDKYFIQVKYGKAIQYDYDNIEFIDVENSEKKKMIIFYSKIAKMRYMLSDENGVVLKTLKKKCNNLMDKEEFYRTHPKER